MFKNGLVIGILFFICSSAAAGQNRSDQQCSQFSGFCIGDRVFHENSNCASFIITSFEYRLNPYNSRASWELVLGESGNTASSNDLYRSQRACLQELLKYDRGSRSNGRGPGPFYKGLDVGR